MGGVGRTAAPSHEVRHDLSSLQRAKRVRRCITVRKIAIAVQGTAYARRSALLGAALGAYWQDATSDRRRRRDNNGPPGNRGRVASRNALTGRRAPSSVALACDPSPFRPRPLSEMVPLRTDYVPVHHWALRAS